MIMTPTRPRERRLIPARRLNLLHPDDDDILLGYLYDFVNRTVKLAPPTDNQEWAEKLAQQYIALAAACEPSPAYDVKRALWRDVLRGAYLTPPDEGAAERSLFARHTLLVIIARAVAETIRPAGAESIDRETRHNILAEGFAAWVLDAPGRGRRNAAARYGGGSGAV